MLSDRVKTAAEKALNLWFEKRFFSDVCGFLDHSPSLASPEMSEYLQARGIGIRTMLMRNRNTQEMEGKAWELYFLDKNSTFRELLKSKRKQVVSQCSEKLYKLDDQNKDAFCACVKDFFTRFSITYPEDQANLITRLMKNMRARLLQLTQQEKRGVGSCKTVAEIVALVRSQTWNIFHQEPGLESNWEHLEACLKSQLVKIARPYGVVNFIELEFMSEWLDVDLIPEQQLEQLHKNAHYLDIWKSFAELIKLIKNEGEPNREWLQRVLKVCKFYSCPVELGLHDYELSDILNGRPLLNNSATKFGSYIISPVAQCNTLQQIAENMQKMKAANTDPNEMFEGGEGFEVNWVEMQVCVKMELVSIVKFMGCEDGYAWGVVNASFETGEMPEVFVSVLPALEEELQAEINKKIKVIWQQVSTILSLMTRVPNDDLLAAIQEFWEHATNPQRDLFPFQCLTVDGTIVTFA